MCACVCVTRGFELDRLAIALEIRPRALARIAYVSFVLGRATMFGSACLNNIFVTYYVEVSIPLNDLLKTWLPMPIYMALL